jgi:hypothetical protein
MAKKWNWDLYNQECRNLPLGILTDPKDIARSEKLEAVRRELLESDPPSLHTGQYDEPKTTEELKLFFDAVIQKSERLGGKSEDVKRLRNWRENDYDPSKRPQLKNGRWDKYAGSLQAEDKKEIPESKRLSDSEWNQAIDEYYLLDAKVSVAKFAKAWTERYYDGLTPLKKREFTNKYSNGESAEAAKKAVQNKVADAIRYDKKQNRNSRK